MRLWLFLSSVNSFFKPYSEWTFVYFHTSCVRTAKALARLRWCAGSPEPSLVAYVIRTIISWAGPFTSNCKTVNVIQLKASLTFKCMTEHLFADFSYSIALDTYLWKQMMQMNRKLIHIWYNVDKIHLLFTKRKCHKFSWLFTASRCSPRRRSICACRIASKYLYPSVFIHWALVF